jgi:lysophospholipase L1-like esterase
VSRGRVSVEPLEDRTLCSVGVEASVVPAPNLDPVWITRDRAVMVQPHGKPNVVFLGDSIFDRWEHGPGAAVWWNHIQPLGAKDLAVTSSTTENVLWEINAGVLNHIHPLAVVLMIGTNNLKENPREVADGIVADVMAIRARQPRAGIILLGLLPRGADPLGQFRWEIPVVNALIAPLAGLPRVRFVDPYRQFLNRDGTLKAWLFVDGIHPTHPGYYILFNDLRSALHAFLGQKVT